MLLEGRTDGQRAFPGLEKPLCACLSKVVGDGGLGR